MYGASESDLHRGLGTDRFVVAWPLDSAKAEAGKTESRDDAATNARILNPDAQVPAEADLAALAAAPPGALRVEIPLDIVRVRDAAPSEAVRWRASTRQAFEWLFANRYSVARFAPDEQRGRGWYILTRNGAGR
jgi:predicted GNAT superfamily acetyltransferase